jgi:hypothetical protein
MAQLTRPTRAAFVALAALTIVLAVSVPSEARDGRGFGGGHPGAAFHHGFGGHHGFDGHHHFNRGLHGHFGIGVAPVFPFYYPYSYAYPYTYEPYSSPAPGYWYYCPSYGAYYPYVGTCPGAWVPVPAS